MVAQCCLGQVSVPAVVAEQTFPVSFTLQTLRLLTAPCPAKCSTVTDN